VYILKFGTVAMKRVWHLPQFRKIGVSPKVAGRASLTHKYLHITIKYKLHIIAVLRDSFFDLFIKF